MHVYTKSICVLLCTVSIIVGMEQQVIEENETVPHDKEIHICVCDLRLIRFLHTFTVSCDTMTMKRFKNLLLCKKYVSNEEELMLIDSSNTVITTDDHLIDALRQSGKIEVRDRIPDHGDLMF